MDAIQRLLRRKERRDVRRIVVTVDKDVLERVRGSMQESGHSLSILFDVFLRGYDRRHPSVLALVDQIRTELGRDDSPSAERTAEFTRREVDDIFEQIEEDKP